jgi:5-methylcytosine-specific restriction endonuclease McrA
VLSFKDIFSDFRSHGDVKDDDAGLSGWRGYHTNHAKLQILCKQCHKNKRKRV